MDQSLVKKTLQELSKREDLENKKCIDCDNPNPQWVSLSFAVFLCLQCAGVHRGFGVHISFVRSVSMDKWYEDQIKRMEIGGNAPFREFMKTYDKQTGGYHQGMNPHDTYHSWAATQYKAKLDATLAGNAWSPSAPPEDFGTPSNSMSPQARPSSAQGLRKSRASARSSTGRSLRSDSASPAPFSNPSSPVATSNPASSVTGLDDQKAANESFFASLGEANASRPMDLPPSQGGRYQGFGNTPTPPSGAQSPPFALSSANAPTLSDLQEHPVAALSKSWSLFSAAVKGASRVVSENVIQPGMEKVTDPNFQAGVRGYVNEAGKRAGQVGRTANLWGKQAFGVDVAESVGSVVGTVKDKVGGGPETRGYGAIGTMGGMDDEEESSSLYHDDAEFFDFHGGSSSQQTFPASSSSQASAASTVHRTTSKKNDDWDDWKDF